MVCILTQMTVRHTNGSTHCHDCPICPPGEGLSHDCGTEISANDVRNVKCVLCIAGKTYSADSNTNPCSACTTCSMDQVILKKCSLTSKIECDKRCYSKGRYYEDTTRDCQECSWCCGNNKDTVKTECQEKGMPRSQSCSIHENDDCKPSPTAKQNTTTPVEQANKSVSVTSQTGLTTASSKVPTTNADGNGSGSLHNNTIIIISALTCSAIVTIIALVCLVVKKFIKCPRTRSGQTGDPLSNAEQGSKHGVKTKKSEMKVAFQTEIEQATVIDNNDQSNSYREYPHIIAPVI